MKYFLTSIIIIGLLFSALLVNSCIIKGPAELLDGEEAWEEIPEQDQDETADRDDQYIQTDPDDNGPGSAESDIYDSTDNPENVQKPENNLMFYNDEADFAFIYPGGNLMLSSYPDWTGDYGDLSLNVSINAIEMLKGSMEKNALDEREALKNGNFGPDSDFPFEPSRRVIKLGDVFVKEFVVFGRYDICNIAFDRIAVFYNNDYQVRIKLSADRGKIMESMGQYFIYDEINCLEEKIWDPDKQDEFYDSLITGQASDPALEWYDAFDDIMYLLQINDFKGASAGYSRLIDKRYFEENLEEKYIIDVAYPQFQSAITGGLEESINKIVYDRKVLSTINDFKDDIASYTDESIGLNYFLAIDYSVLMYDKNGISLCLDIYPYMGGAHGMLYFETINFDFEKNDLIKLKDLFVPGYDYLNIISRYCREDLIRQMKERGFQPDEEWIEDGTDPGYMDTFTNFLITPSGLIMKFPAYQVASYAAGDFSVNIPYDRFEGYIDPHSIIASYN